MFIIGQGPWYKGDLLMGYFFLQTTWIDFCVKLSFTWEGENIRKINYYTWSGPSILATCHIWMGMHYDAYIISKCMAAKWKWSFLSRKADDATWQRQKPCKFHFLINENFPAASPSHSIRAWTLLMISPLISKFICEKRQPINFCRETWFKRSIYYFIIIFD